MGVPPSGGFVAKWLMLSAAAMEGQWWWALVILVGGLLAGAYVIRVLARAMADASGSLHSARNVPRRREAVPLALAICALLLGLVPLQPSELLQIGRPDALGGTLAMNGAAIAARCSPWRAARHAAGLPVAAA